VKKKQLLRWIKNEMIRGAIAFIATLVATVATTFAKAQRLQKRSCPQRLLSDSFTVHLP